MNLVVSRGAFATLMVAIALFATGCWASLIPLAIQGVGMVGKLVSGGVEAGTMAKHSDDQNPEETELMDETAGLNDADFDKPSSKKPDNSGKCDELELITPAIIEFRTDRDGITKWRELGLGGTTDSPRWMVVAEADATTAKDDSPGGWAPATNLDHMEFTPPLKTSAAPGLNSFMAYAPATSLNEIERDRLASLMIDFGPVAGTFKSDGRKFTYSKLEKLPCFPVPD